MNDRSTPTLVILGFLTILVSIYFTVSVKADDPFQDLKSIIMYQVIWVIHNMNWKRHPLFIHINWNAVHPAI